MTSRDQHRDVVSVEEDLVEFGDSLAFRSVLDLCDVFQKHVDEIIESKERSSHLLVVLHEDVNARSDALVDEFWGERRVFGKQ